METALGSCQRDSREEGKGREMGGERERTGRELGKSVF